MTEFRVALAAVVWLGYGGAPPLPSSPAATWVRKTVPSGSLRIVPSFTGGMAGPEFQLEYTNTSTESTDALNVFQQEAIRLDGRVYPRLVIRWAGNIPPIPPKGTWRHTLTIADFLPGERKPGWRVPLSPGLHSISFSVGQSASSETQFVWRGDT